MSDHDAAPDPIDEAYRKAEAALSDEAARAARRARVLAAVGDEAQTPASAPVAIRRSFWRPGGALAAAAVAGLSVLLALHFRQASPFRADVAPAPDKSAGGAIAENADHPPGAVAPGAPAAHAPAPPPPRVTRQDRSAARDVAAPPPTVRAGPPPDASPNAPAIPPLPVPPAPVRVEEPAPPAAAPRDIVVTAQRRAESLAEARVPAAEPSAASAFAGKATAGSRADQARRLGAAAAAGRIDEVKALLAQGTPIDAADADGETALMKSIRTGQSSVAELLRKRGASLDLANRAGETARDLAAEKDDPKLDKALGLTP